MMVLKLAPIQFNCSRITKVTTIMIMGSFTLVVMAFILPIFRLRCSASLITSFSLWAYRLNILVDLRYLKYKVVWDRNPLKSLPFFDSSTEALLVALYIFR